jgi:hypothetical protein
MLDWMDLAPLGFWLLVGGGAYFVVPPLLILFTQKMAASPQIVEYDATTSTPPPLIADYFARCAVGLQASGFRRLSSVALPDPVPNVRAILELYVHEANRDAAMVSAVFGIAPNTPTLQTRYVEFISEFHAHELQMIQTNNNLEVGAFPELPDAPTFRFPQVADAERLYRLHRELVERHARAATKSVPVLDEFHGNVTEYLRTKVLRESYERQVATGYLRYNRDRDCYVPTVVGAFKMTWKLMWPAKPIIQNRYRHNGRRLEEELLGVSS